jgi:hypothetical protein
MLRDGRPGHLEPRGDLPRRKLSVENNPEDLPATGLGNRLQDGFHSS